MKNVLVILGVLSLTLLLGVTQFSSNTDSSTLDFSTVPKDFVYDGCSMFPDGNYADCCTKHDTTYFFGGSWQERLASDTQLMKCVMKKDGVYHIALGPMMWVGVRIGGAPIWPTPFRWGFGRDLY